MLLAGAAGWLAGGLPPGGPARLRRLGRPGPRPGGTSLRFARPPDRLLARPPDRLLARLPATGAVAAFLLAVLGSPGAAVLVLAVATATGLPARRREAAALRRQTRTARDLPRVADLLATCLEAGAAPADALGVVAEHVDGPVAQGLRPVAAALRTGADPAAAWALLPSEQAAGLRRLARTFVRAAATGAPLAQSLSAYAEDERAVLRGRAEASARRAGIRAVAPLGLCFLPAFLLLGVVPVVAGVATQVLGDLS